ncbi:hypothetical protein HCN51_55005 [Nonomuraea sp. FMUSA5-5]|uniref:Uncharacterized protein n=1 Tax=Nonomuraea composti TaxID=2720023 RepID=A0ABX1BL40_9ACTN|nr:hypothetical protein [Nonomuraea sp. FMUSA5-5]NJP98440.1 hypothetical protein [Nonomuraea sp. FMUSA5-5]
MAAIVAAWLAWTPWPIVGGVERDHDWAFLLAPLPVASLLFLAAVPTLFPQLLPMWPLQAALALAILVMALTGWDGGQVLGGIFLAIVCGVIPATTAAWAVLMLRRHGAADWHERQTDDPA